MNADIEERKYLKQLLSSLRRARGTFTYSYNICRENRDKG